MTVPDAEKQIRNLAQEPALRPERGIEHWSEQTLRDLIELLPDAVVVIDARGVIVLVNGQTDRIFGYQRQEMVGQRIELLIPELSRWPSFRDLMSNRGRPMGRLGYSDVARMIRVSQISLSPRRNRRLRDERDSRHQSTQARWQVPHTRREYPGRRLNRHRR
jgi:PAS domain-containing protein